MKKLSLLFVLLITLPFSSFGQKIKISENLELTKISDNVYIHTQNNNNGIVYFNNNEAIIVSTPDSDTETQNLIDWVNNKAQITAYIIDRWHPDAMQGLDVVNSNNIHSYSTTRTKKIAKQKGLPISKTTFKTKKTIQVGDEKVICHYLGEAHTTDGIVVWIPSEKTLFGGNEIRNKNGWIGNIGDANIQEWSSTAKRIKEHYSSAQIVIPGHGIHGSSELIDYTIQLYDFSQKKSKTKEKLINPLHDKKLSIVSELDTIIDNKNILTNAQITVQDDAKLIIVEAPQVELQKEKLYINAETGRVKIYDKKGEMIVLRTDVNFNKLFVIDVDDPVGFAVVLKEITSYN